MQRLALSRVLLAMIYPVSDSLQMTLAGALRGYKDSRTVMLIALVAWWPGGLVAWWPGGWWG